MVVRTWVLRTFGLRHLLGLVISVSAGIVAMCEKVMYVKIAVIIWTKLQQVSSVIHSLTCCMLLQAMKTTAVKLLLFRQTRLKFYWGEILDSGSHQSGASSSPSSSSHSLPGSLVDISHGVIHSRLETFPFWKSFAPYHLSCFRLIFWNFTTCCLAVTGGIILVSVTD